jgi:uncharacterized protein (TIGR03382 family)
MNRTALALFILVAASARAQTPLILDHFDGDAGRALSVHSPDVGLPGSWQNRNPNNLELSGAGTLYCSQKNQGGLYANQTPLPGNEYRVSVIGHWANLNRTNELGLTARISPTDSTRYLFMFHGDGEADLVRANADGGSTTLGQVFLPITLGDHRLDFVISDALKQGLIDGVPVLSSTDNVLLAGPPGLQMTWFTSQGGVYADDFAVYAEATLPDGGQPRLPDGGLPPAFDGGEVVVLPDGGTVDVPPDGRYHVGCGCGAAPVGPLALLALWLSARRRRR